MSHERSTTLSADESTIAKYGGPIQSIATLAGVGYAIYQNLSAGQNPLWLIGQIPVGAVVGHYVGAIAGGLVGIIATGVEIIKEESDFRKLGKGKRYSFLEKM